MKLMTIVAVLSLTLTTAFAAQPEKKKEGHDKEHSHVTEKVDHQHEEGHHQPHDHKAHHPDHVDAVKKTETTTTKKK